MQLLNLLLLVLFAYFLATTFYFLLFGFASLFPVPQRKIKEKRLRKIAVLIPGYREDAVIYDVARDALEQSYDKNYYDVVVIADSFQPETIQKLRELPLKVVEVSFEKSTKAKALNKAMEVIGDDYDVVMILDADNLMEEDCLVKINDSFDKGFKAVQGHRVAKNLNTNFAVLDAISEEINNNIFRKGQRVLGFSSGLIGSGMAFDYAYFKSKMKTIDAIGGFDKELELRILEDKEVMEFRSDAWVYDEKVQKAEVFYNQRRRWVSSQGRYFYNTWGQAWKLLFRDGNINYFNKVFQWIFPPRVIYIGSVVALGLLVWFLHPDQNMRMAWGIVMIAGILSFLLAVPRRYYNFRTLKAVVSLPRAFFLMLLAILRVKGSNKEFIHTEHTSLGDHDVKKLQRSKAG